MAKHLTALRGLAILLVLLNHSIGMGELNAADGWVHPVIDAIAGLGIFAVPTFLFAAGCFAVYAAATDTGRLSWLSWKPVWSGLRYILGPYLFWSIVFYILLYVGHSTAYPTLQYGKDLLVGYPFHFVPLLVFFYLISPILVRACRRYGWWVIAGIGLYQLLLIGIVFPTALGVNLPQATHILEPKLIGSTLAEWAIYYPLGVLMALRAKRILPFLRRWIWAGFALTAVLFVFYTLDAAEVLHFGLSGYLCALAACSVIPTIRREQLPYVQQIEGLGKRSYPLYLTNIIVMDTGLVLIRLLIPGLLAYDLLLIPLLFALALAVPLLVMAGAQRLVRRPRYRTVAGPMYRYVFG